jgi:hypothetical protein
MSLQGKRAIVAILSIFFLVSLLIVAWIEGGKQRVSGKPVPVVSGANRNCVSCHQDKTPVIVGQWQDSQHAQKGVGCLECHEAGKGEPDAYRHEGSYIATIVSPKDCARCHEKETGEFAASHHAKGAQFVGSLDNVLGELAEGPMAAANGCWQCHGSTVQFVQDTAGNVVRDESGKPKFDPTRWPNTGIGRVNLDGSLGACSACHSRHVFSKAMARQPETCGKCHMGPDHPQIEIFTESKHGIAFRTRINEMNLEADKWVLGEDYSAAPTCSTCHMSATRNLPVTHDVGSRISWTLRPVVSKKLDNWEEKRDRMKETCNHCHSPEFTNGFYQQYDSTIDLYNNKFALPAQRIMDGLKGKGKITPSPFDDEIEWTFYHLWHHEGRRARMGISMQGPDYTQWHGFFEVAHRFYFELLPKAKELAHGEADLEKLIRDIEQSPEHKWKQGLSKDELQKIQQFYKERYEQK